MFHAYCIIHPSESVRSEEVKRLLSMYRVHRTDQWRTDSPTVTIHDIRHLKQFLSLKPFASPSKAAVIEADLLSFEAQHALLKTLEEPPPHSLLLLSVGNVERLLPTITSRCILIKLDDKPNEVTNEQIQAADRFWNKLSTSSIGERLQVGTELAKDRTTVEGWLNEQIVLCRSMLWQHVTASSVSSYSPLEYILLIRQLLQTLNFIQKNISIKLAIDHLLLSLPNHPPPVKKDVN